MLGYYNFLHTNLVGIIIIIMTAVNDVLGSILKTFIVR